MRLAIAAQDPTTVTETFVRMQYERLPCALRVHGAPVASETHPGGPIAPLRSLRGLVETAYDVGLRRTKWDGPQSRELARRLRAARIDTLLANFGTYAVILMPICAALGIRVVAHFHGTDAHTAATVARLGDGYRALGQQAHRVVVVSDFMQRALVEAGMPPGKLRVVRYGVDTTRFCPKASWPTTPVFLGVGRFVDKKAPYLTLLAFSRVHAAVPGARLVLAGDGPLLETTRTLCQVLGLDEAVEFPGPLAHDAVAARMAGATAFVQHSIRPEYGPARGDCEGTPVAVLEAMASGLPVVATRHAGIGEVIEDGVTGLLVAERDVDGMAAAMLALCHDPDRARRLGQAARDVAMSRYRAEDYIDGLRAALA
jgi:colanic acid/amylovoran biosynthesis glycosyltransferase